MSYSVETTKEFEKRIKKLAKFVCVSNTDQIKSLNICYVAPDIPVPHTGDFIGGSYRL